jgi:hypothetical protein
VRDVRGERAVARLARAGQSQQRVHVAAPVEDQEERDRQHGDELADGAEHLDRNRLQRTRRAAQPVWQRTRVAVEVRGDVVAVVVAPDRRVAPELDRVARRVVRDLTDLLNHARDHHGSHDDDARGEDQEHGEDEWRARDAHAGVDRVDDR